MSFIEEQVWPVLTRKTDVDLVMSQTNASETIARETLIKHRGDIVEAIMELQHKNVVNTISGKNVEVRVVEEDFKSLQNLEDGIYKLEVKTIKKGDQKTKICIITK